MPKRSLLSGLLLALLPSVAAAQQPTGAAGAAPNVASSSAPRIGPVDASRLRPGRWEFAVRLLNAGEVKPLGPRTLAVTEATYAGAPAWLIVDDRTSGPARLTDSLFVRRTDLTPLHRAAHVGDATVVNEFTADSITGSVTAPGASTPVQLASRPGVMANGAMLEVLLPLLPFAEGWRGSTDILVIGPRGQGLVPLELAVMGEETVEVEGARYPSWRLLLRSRNNEQRIWVTKDGHRLVRLAQLSPNLGPGAVLETVAARPTTP